MGAIVELNTLLALPTDFDTKTLTQGRTYTVIKNRERVFPLHIALLVADKNWNFYGYCVAHSSIIKDQKTHITFEMLSLFSPKEQTIYKNKFLEAANQTGELYNTYDTQSAS